MTKLRIADNLSLPREAVTETFAILAKRGVGKTYTAAVMVEEMLSAGLQVCVADPVGVWWGLRAAADGKRAGLPIVVLGGDHGDAPLDVAGGEVVADLVADDHLSVVLDLSRFRKGEQTRFMEQFAERLYYKNRQPVHLVLDEADAFAPQRPLPGQQRLLGAVEDLVRRGRARGLGVTLITQRSAVLNKDVLTQVEVLIALRTIAPQDREAIDAWVKVHGTPAEREQLMQSLPSLPIGTAWFWSPGWLGIFKRVQVRKRETFDSSATPALGSGTAQPRKLASIDLDSLRSRLAATIERAKSDDPRELRRRIVELEKQLQQRPAQLEPQRVEVPVITDAQIAEMRAAVVAVQEAVKGTDAAWRAFAKVGETWQAAIDHVQGRRAANEQPRIFRPARPGPVPAARAPAAPPIAGENGTAGLRAGERTMLQVLAQFDHLGGLTRSQLALLSGYTRSGTFDAYAATLTRHGFAEKSFDKLRIAEAGRGYLGSGALPAPRSTAELQQLFASKLRAGERTMLEILIREYPRGITRDDLAQRSGYSKSGTFDAYAATLTRNGLAVKDRGELRASETLFLA